MKLTVKIVGTEWLGRTVFRAYYKAGKTWKRYGKWEAASPAQLRDIVNTHCGAAQITWKDEGR